MPFTPSHAVVALPFVRTPLIPAAIAVGAMTPDVPLFLRGTPLTYSATHANVVLTALVALVLLLVWWAVLRPAVRELGPRWLSVRLPEDWDAVGLDIVETVHRPRPGARNPVWRDGGVFAALLAISLLIGVISHVVWDAFTHEGRWGLDVFPALTESWGPLPGYKWLQYGSSIGGLVIIAVWALVWLIRRAPAASVGGVLPAWVRWAWWLSLPGILVVAWLAGMAAHGPFTAGWTPPHLAYLVLPPACAVWGVITLVLCVLVQVARARRRSRPQ
ncbi:DUF4184 family protein [Microbacterium invictum]|uniref:Cell wall anchor protein n=1 Tax=Microbacterium invictum TaxID=515415 RepID=A0AA40SNG3_9MICO|nr:DUF4184 family protein [Microbacterium invictum]MBB4139483.1 hypothetical protein [Microbacterium invictum]